MLPVFLRLHILFGFNDEPTVCRRNIPGSWGFNWNWYVCYSNSEIPRSKGICYSRFAITILPHLMAPIPCLHMFSTIFYN
ncbi:unnamed protein product, partial [Vitis vinifera]